MQCFLLRPDGREVMGDGLSQCGAPLRALALGYDCRALRALPLRGLHKLPSWGTERCNYLITYQDPIKFSNS
jgi:hypothetical protein